MNNMERWSLFFIECMIYLIGVLTGMILTMFLVIVGAGQ